MNVLGSIATSSGWHSRADMPQERARLFMRMPYVTLTIYGDGDDAEPGSEPSPERAGYAAGLMFRAAEAALALDPLGKAVWKQRRDTYEHRGITHVYIYHTLDFVASSDDVFSGGPIHLERARACSRAMRSSLDEGLNRDETL